MKPKLLILGGNGFIGAYMARMAAECYEVAAPGHADADVASARSIRDVFRREQPQAVALLAGIADIDRAERDPDRTELVNVTGPVRVATECAAGGVRLLLTSTGAVFDGTKHGYVEEDSPTPVSVYGQSKARAEKLVSAILPSSLIVRLPLVLGRSLRPEAPGFVDKLEKSLRAGDSVLAPPNEFRNAIDVATLNRLMLELLASGASGIFHIGSTDSLSRVQIARKIAIKLGFSPDLVREQTDIPAGRAPRGPDHFLITKKLASTVTTPIPTSDESIERCLHATT